MRLVRLVVVLLSLGLWLVPASVLAHDDVSGTPDVTIRINASGVSDQSVAVPVGGIVAFVNQDDGRHRMRSRTEPGEFDTGDIEPGERSLVRFSTEGSVHYVDERTERSAFGGTISVRGATSGGGGSGSGGTGGGAGAGGSTSKAASITIGDRVFTPGSVTVSTGATVTWTNRDDREHTATSTDGGAIASPVMSSGEVYRKTFNQAGTFAYLCAIHPEMRGTVKVVGSTGSAPAPAPATPTPKPTPAPAATPSPDTTPTPTVPPETGPATGPGVVEAGIVDFAFQPTPVTIAAGGTVTWVNRGAAPHTVTASDDSFDSSLIEAGGSFSQAFATPGRYAFVCTFHPDMAGTVEVTAPSAGTAAPDASATPAPTSTPSGTPDPTPSLGSEAVVVPAATEPPADPESNAEGIVPQHRPRIPWPPSDSCS